MHHETPRLTVLLIALSTVAFMILDGFAGRELPIPAGLVRPALRLYSGSRVRHHAWRPKPVGPPVRQRITVRKSGRAAAACARSGLSAGWSALSFDSLVVTGSASEGWWVGFHQVHHSPAKDRGNYQRFTSPCRNPSSATAHIRAAAVLYNPLTASR